MAIHRRRGAIVTTRGLPASLNLDRHTTARQSVALPLVMELAVLLEAPRVYLRGGASSAKRIADELFAPGPFLVVESPLGLGQLIERLWRMPSVLRSHAADHPQAGSFVVDQHRLCGLLDSGPDRCHPPATPRSLQILALHAE